MQNAHQVCKNRLPYTKLKLMHEIRNEHLIKVESVFKESKRKHILKYLVRVTADQAREWTYPGGNQRVGFEKTINKNTWDIDPIFKHQSMSMIDHILNFLWINSCQLSTSFLVDLHSKTWYFGLEDEATWTRTLGKIFKARHQNPMVT